MSFHPRNVWAAFLLVALAGCTAAPASNSPDLPLTDSPSGKKGSSEPKPTDTTISERPTPGEAPTPASAEEAKSYIFAHDDRALYRLDPSTSTLTKVGAFNCLRSDEQVIDMAVSSTGAAYATTFNANGTYSRFMKFDPLNASCTIVAESTTRLYPNALSFAPKGSVDPNADALVGYENTTQGTVYVRIDLVSGAVSNIGYLQRDLVSTRIKCSGDIVALDDGKAYLTVRAVDGTGSDSLVEVNPKTGELIKTIGPTGFEELWGLAYWQNKAYAFSGNGEILQLDLTTGKATKQTVMNAPPSFYGAAVSTVAPKM